MARSDYEDHVSDRHRHRISRRRSPSSEFERESKGEAGVGSSSNRAYHARNNDRGHEEEVGNEESWAGRRRNHRRGDTDEELSLDGNEPLSHRSRSKREASVSDEERPRHKRPRPTAAASRKSSSKSPSPAPNSGGDLPRGLRVKEGLKEEEVTAEDASVRRRSSRSFEGSASHSRRSDKSDRPDREKSVSRGSTHGQHRSYGRRGSRSRSRSPGVPHRRGGYDDYHRGYYRHGSPRRREYNAGSRAWHSQRGYGGVSGGSSSRGPGGGGPRRDWGDWREEGRGRDWYNRGGGDGGRKGEDKGEGDVSPMTEEEKKKKELEDARRDDLTVLVVNLSLKAQERDIWQFFTKHAGKVRTIKLIKDSRSGKSKGIGYVEFQDAESVLKSLNLTGQCILNQPIRVQASQAEKNRAAKAAKQQQEQLAAQGPTKIYIGGLIEELSGMTQDELCQLFSPYGPILQIDVPKDPYTHRNRGYAFVQYSEAAHARDAMMAMHNFDIGGKHIKVGFAGQDQGKAAGGSSIDSSGGVDLDRIADDHDDRILHGGSAMRIALSQKLAQKVNDQSFNGLMGAASGASANSPLKNSAANPPPTEVVTLEGMFSKQEVEEDGVDILDEVCEDVKKECLKFGVVIDLFIDHENIDGRVHVRFADASQAVSAVKNLNGRFFGGTAIKASYSDPVEYATMRQNAL